jgi:hypothetical protein
MVLVLAVLTAIAPAWPRVAAALLWGRTGSSLPRAMGVLCVTGRYEGEGLLEVVGNWVASRGVALVWPTAGTGCG